MENTLEVGNFELIRIEAVGIIRRLIAREISREGADSWTRDLHRDYGDDVTDKIRLQDPPLADLIDALPLAITPNEPEGWLYDTDDFQAWLQDYIDESEAK